MKSRSDQALEFEEFDLPVDRPTAWRWSPRLSHWIDGLVVVEEQDELPFRDRGVAA
jgi:hypothetical protein